MNRQALAAYLANEEQRARLRLRVLAPGLPEGAVGVPYTGGSFATVNAEEPVTFTLIYGSTMPPGLTLDADDGAVAGTPTDAGSYAVSVHVLDNRGLSAEVTTTFEIAA